MAAFASESVRRGELLRASGLSVGRPGGSAPLLEDVDLALTRGECVLLRGATGSGKSTLLRLLGGLRGVDRRAGVLEAPRRVALLSQAVETQLLCTTVAEEVRLGLRNRGLSPDAVECRAATALDQVGLGGFATREVDRLSAGQKQRTVLAALIALEPELLLLDEPCAALDASGRAALASVLSSLKARGTTLLIAEHAPRELLAIVDRCVAIDDRRLCDSALPALEPSATTPRPTLCDWRPRDALPSPLPGERVLLTGPNGSGKSSALRALAHEAAPPRHVALVIQEARRSLFARTVAAEVEFSLQRRGASSRDRTERVRELLGRFDLLPFAERSPRRLSFGQQHRLAIAAAIAARPELVLLDEPFAGLDATARALLLDCLDQEGARSGTAFILASHDRRPLDAWCDRVICLAGETERV